MPHESFAGADPERPSAILAQTVDQITRQGRGVRGVKADKPHAVESAEPRRRTDPEVAIAGLRGDGNDGAGQPEFTAVGVEGILRWAPAGPTRRGRNSP